jgi:hypothetical protein
MRFRQYLVVPLVLLLTLGLVGVAAGVLLAERVTTRRLLP